MSRRARATSNLNVFDPGYNRPEVDGTSRRQRHAAAPRTRHVTFSSQSDSSDGEFSSNSDESGEAYFRSRQLREKLSEKTEKKTLDSTSAKKTKTRNGRTTDEVSTPHSVQAQQMAARPSSYVRFKYPVKFHRIANGAQRGQKEAPNFNIPECMRRPTSIAMMPVRQRPVSERGGGGAGGRSGNAIETRKLGKFTSSRRSEIPDLERSELETAQSDDDYSTMTSHDVELNGVVHIVHDDDDNKINNRVQTQGSASDGETDPETATRNQTVGSNTTSSSSDSGEEHSTLETEGRQKPVENEDKKKKKLNKKKKVRSSSRTDNDNTNLLISINDDLVE